MATADSISTTSSHLVTIPVVPGGVAPRRQNWLENGDRLSRAEFERRWDAMPELKRAELIEGVVYLPSPVRIEAHGMPHAMVVTWCGNYAATTPATKTACEASVRLDDENMPQPDVVLFFEPGLGG